MRAQRLRVATHVVCIVMTVCASGCAAQGEPKYPIQTRKDVWSRHARGESFDAISAELGDELALRIALVAHDSASTESLETLGIVHQEIGDVQLAMHDALGALSEYRAGLSIFEALTAVDPSNTNMRRRVALGHSNLGDARLELGDRAAALAEYQSSLATIEELAEDNRSDGKLKTQVARSVASIGPKDSLHGSFPSTTTSAAIAVPLDQSRARHE